MKEYIENGIRYGMLEEGDVITDKTEARKLIGGEWYKPHIRNIGRTINIFKNERFRIRLEEPKDEPRCAWCGGHKDIRRRICLHPGCIKAVPLCEDCFHNESRVYCSEHVHLYRDKGDDCPAIIENGKIQECKHCGGCDDEGTDKEPQKPEEKDAGTKALESVLDKVDKMTPEEYREEYDKIKDMPDAPEAILDYTPQAAIVRGAPPSQAFGSIQCFKASEEELMARDKRDLFNKATGEDGR